jgi:hypothetical protein
MNKHVKRVLVAALAIATVIVTGLWVYQQTSSEVFGAGAALLLGIAFLHAHLCQLVRDQMTRLASRRV